MELLSEIARSGEHAVLAVTHDPRTMRFADRIIEIEDGRIVGEKGPPEGIDTIHKIASGKKRKSDAKQS